MCITRFGRANNFLMRSTCLAVLQILLDRPREEPSVLQDHTEEFTDISTLHFFRRHTINRDIPAIWVVETHKEINNRRLTGAGRADDRNLHAGLNLDREIFNNRTLLVVRKVNIMKTDCAFDSGNFRCWDRIRRFLGFI